jgi:hypothetical protein
MIRIRSLRRRTPAAALAMAMLLLAAPGAQAGEFALYLLAGQSNMDGYGSVVDLPEDLTLPQDGVWIFHGNTVPDGLAPDGRGAWMPLGPGHGVGFASDGEEHWFSDRFGVELSFAARLRIRHPDRKIALVKYSRGGTSIAAELAGDAGCWDPDYVGGTGEGAGVNQYDHCLATLRRATAVRDIDGDGEDDVLVPAGIVWMQGESDSNGSPAIALRYEANLARLMDLLRAALRVDDLPVAVGRISDSGEATDGTVWTYGDVIRAAQHAYCDADPTAVLVIGTDYLRYSDPWHYDSAGYIKLGVTFADALKSLEPGWVDEPVDEAQDESEK